MKRRQFLEASSKLACGFTGAVSFLSLGPMQAVAATDEPEPGPNIIGPRPPFSPQIGTLISMLNWMRRGILIPVQGLTVAQLDYLHDESEHDWGTSPAPGRDRTALSAPYFRGKKMGGLGRRD